MLSIEAGCTNSPFAEGGNIELSLLQQHCSRTFVIYHGSGPVVQASTKLTARLTATKMFVVAMHSIAPLRG